MHYIIIHTLSHSACFRHQMPPSQRKSVAMGDAGSSDEPPS